MKYFVIGITIGFLTTTSYRVAVRLRQRCL